MRHSIIILLLCAMTACSAAPPAQLSVESYADELFAPPPPNPTTIVQPYDTVLSIAQREHVSLRDLMALNKLTPPFVMLPGTKLLLPMNAKPKTAAVKTTKRRGVMIIEAEVLPLNTDGAVLYSQTVEDPVTPTE